jgi:hypothetical protein
MSRSPVRVSEPPRPRTQGAAAWMLLPTLGRSRTRIGRCQATPYSAEIRDGAARLAELRLRAVRRAARQRRGRRRARSPTRACPRSRRRTRGRGAMRARTAVPRRGPGGRGARARPGGRGDRRARRPRRHGRSADPERIRYRDTAPVLGRIRASWTSSSRLSLRTTDESQVGLLAGPPWWESEVGRGRRRVKAQTVGLWSAARLALLKSHEMRGPVSRLRPSFGGGL